MDLEGSNMVAMVIAVSLKGRHGGEDVAGHAVGLRCGVCIARRTPVTAIEPLLRTGLVDLGSDGRSGGGR